MNHEVQVEQNGVPKENVRPGFNHEITRKLSIAVLFLGIACFCAGVATLVIALRSRCTYGTNWIPDYDHIDTETRGCDYYATYISPGLWCGVTFLASGIIGIVTARKKTTCLIVLLMALSIVSSWIAVCGILTSITAHFDKPDRLLDPYHYHYPISLHVLDSVITLICLASFVMFWIQFGYTCRAVCCNGRKGLPEITSRHQYQPLQPQPILVSQPQTISSAETVYLVQGRRVIGVLPQAFSSVPQRDDADAAVMSATLTVEKQPTLQQA